MEVLTDPTLTDPADAAAQKSVSQLGSGPVSLLSGPVGPVVDRSRSDAGELVAEAVRLLARELPVAAPSEAEGPIASDGQGSLLDLWSTLAGLGRNDLCVARLTEGHIDAVRILQEAGMTPVPDAVYGVWASASGGTGLTAVPRQSGGWTVDGRMRFCSGAWFIDRALTVVSTPVGKLLVDVDLGAPGLTRLEETWPALGMNTTRSVDVDVAGLDVPASAAVGGPGFYLDRPGFTLGGVGVAAVWLGGAHGVLEAVLSALDPSRATAHQRAHLGAMAVAISSADALLAQLAITAQPAQTAPTTEPEQLSLQDMTAARSAVEMAVAEVLTRAPRLTGPNGLARNGRIAHQIADLEVYVRQHHGETDYEFVGEQLLKNGTLLGRSFR